MARRLAAILAADVVGYSKLMAEDEAGTLAALKTHRAELFDPETAKRGGRIVKLMGDGVLVEFSSVVDAVECALAIQRALAGENDKIKLRIGVNLGDVIIDGEDIYGDGVNVAARLEALAEPGGIAISGIVHEGLGNRVEADFIDAGEQQVKNIARPIRLFRWSPARLSKAGARAPKTSERPSIAVLPFKNLSDDPAQDYFADGLVEELIIDLSKMPGLFVIARNSTFAYKGKAVDIREVAKALGVRYVLEGSVRKFAGRVRITGQLVEGAGGTHVWADKFEGAVEDIFNLQDQLTDSIVGALEPTLRRVEIERARRKRPEVLDAYDFYLRALPHAFDNILAENDEAIRLLNESLRLDPNYAPAHAHASWCYEQRFFRGGFNPDDRTAALEHARLALKFGADDTQALCIGAFVQANITHDYESAIRILDPALEMNSNSALALGFSALVHAISGSYERASEQARKALRLSPTDPLNYHPNFALAMVCIFNGRFEEAIHHASLAIQTKPSLSVPYILLVASHVKLDNFDSARAAANQLLAVAPGFTISGFVRADYWRPPLMKMLAAALRTAGLPE